MAAADTIANKRQRAAQRAAADSRARADRRAADTAAAADSDSRADRRARQRQARDSDRPPRRQARRAKQLTGLYKYSVGACNLVKGGLQGRVQAYVYHAYALAPIRATSPDDWQALQPC